MKKLFKRVSILFAALMALSVSTVRTVEEVKAAENTVATFEFGANGTAAHDDGSTLGSSKSYTEGSYTLSLTSMSGVYGPAYDAKGNSCIKLGTSKATGTFSFTVPENITSVYIYAAKYKANTSKVSVNGESYTLSGASNSGAYDELVVDTSSTKTVKFSTVTGGVRCMVNTIKFNVSDGVEEELTTAQIIENGLNNLKKSIKTFYGVSTDVELPATNEDGVNFTYTLSDNDEASFAIDEDGILTSNPKNVLETAKLTIAAELNGESSTTEVNIASASTTDVLPLSEAVKIAKYFGTSYSDDKFYIEVDIVSVYNTTYGNLYVKDDTVTSNFTVYGTYSADGSKRYDAMETKPIAGDTVKLYGVLGMYKTTVQMQNAWIVEHTIGYTNEELIAMEETSFSLSFDYALTYKEEEVEGTGEETTASISFASTAQRVHQNNDQQLWENDGVRLINDQSSSTSNVADTSNPVRLYASSKVTIEVDEPNTITKIVFVANNATYADALKNSIGTEAIVSENTVTCTPTNSSNVYEIAKLSAQVRLNSLSVTYASVGGTVEVVDTQAYANVGLTFGAKVTSSLFEGYTKVSGGVMIDNAANYANTTIAEAYANGEFKGITTSKESLKLTDDGFYSVGSTIEVIDGLVDENNKKYLSYEFVAAVYFTLENAEGTTTVVLEQKAYSVSTMVDYYLANSSSLGLTDEAVKVVEAFDTFIG